MTEPWQHLEIALQDLYEVLGSGIESGEFSLEDVQEQMQFHRNRTLGDDFTAWWKNERKQ